MITEQDLNEAIAECQGERHPNANTCIKLAAYFTIYNQLFGNFDKLKTRQMPDISQMYSALPAQPIGQSIKYNSDTEFARTIRGMTVEEVMSVFDELMSTLWALYPQLYHDVMQKLQ